MEERFESLFSEWSSLNHHKGKGFVSDGIIDKNRWEKTERKILFILKEAYSDPTDPEDFDLCELIRDKWQGPKHPIWWNLSYWAYGIHNSNHLQTIRKPEKNNEKERALIKESLLSSAVLNIKKSSGNTQSNPDDLKHYVLNDGEFIKREIELINPSIIICGYVWEYLDHLWPNANQVYDLVYRDGKTFIVDFWHPANRFHPKLNYYCLMSVISNSGYFSSV